MKWPLRNIWLTLAWAAVLLMLGLSTAYLFSSVATSRQAEQQLGAVRAGLDGVWKILPAPTSNNLALVTAEVQKAMDFLAECQPLLQPTVVPKLDVQQYKARLTTTLVSLRAAAKDAGIDCQADPDFTFSAQGKMLNFSPPSIPLLLAQLEEIRSLSESMFRPGVRKIIKIRRVATSEHDAPNSPDTFGPSSQIKKILIPRDLLPAAQKGPLPIEFWPYELTFECTSEALAAVLNNIASAPQLRIVKEVEVQRLPDDSPKAPPAANKPTTESAFALKEHPLRVKVLLFVVKPVP